MVAAMKKVALPLGVGLVFFMLAVFYAVFDLMRYAYNGAASTVDEPRTVIVPSGQRFVDTTEQLLEAGVIQKPNRFRAFARLYGYDKRVKAGEYLLSTAMSPAKVIETLILGKVVLHRLTVPEGYTYRQIGDLLEKTGLVTASEFITRARDAELVRQFGVPGETLEGYLYPDTYFFPRGVTAREIITAMIHRFETVMTSQWKERAAQLQLSVHQVMTLASIIEKETGAPEERAIISSVFFNRLHRGMRLESDPTVIYGITDFDGNITRNHLKEKTPYNTYQIEGLPPGPIANPGKEAIHAALFPQQTDFLFFVSKQNGTHHFSKDMKEHLRAVSQYQLRK